MPKWKSKPVTALPLHPDETDLILYIGQGDTDCTPPIPTKPTVPAQPAKTPLAAKVRPSTTPCPRFKAYLLKQYGFPDRRVKDPRKVTWIRIDTWTPSDVYPNFCHLSVHVPEEYPDHCLLHIQNLPEHSLVFQILREADLPQRMVGNNRYFLLYARNRSHRAFLRKLANSLTRIRKAKEKFPDKNWIWIIPRTAIALKDFACHLDTCNALLKVSPSLDS